VEQILQILMLMKLDHSIRTVNKPAQSACNKDAKSAPIAGTGITISVFTTGLKRNRIALYVSAKISIRS
jgi:hypothetical protein